MASDRVTRVLCAADPGGSGEALEALVEATADRDVQALALVGNLGGDRGLRSLFKAMIAARVPSFWVPGPQDAPIRDYLREAANTEIAASFLRGVHGTAALASDGHVLFAGFGGEVSDDPESGRDEIDRLVYPRWEPEYRLKLLREFDEHQVVLLFSTPPAHKGHGTAGSEVLAELVATYRPRLVVSGGEPSVELIGRSLVVAPGSLSEGRYAIADLHAGEAQLEQLETPAWR
jgi:Icc-related predicted phosphoesterase